MTEVVEEVAVTEVVEAVVEEVAVTEVVEAVVEEVAVTEVVEAVVEEVAVTEVVETVKTESMTVVSKDAQHQEQLRQMEQQHRQAMMQQQQMMMKYFSDMMLKQNAVPQMGAGGKPARVQRVIIVPVPAYSFGLNSGSHMVGNAASMHEMHHGHKATEAKDMGNVVEPVK